VRLTEIFRQAAESLIVVNAHRIHDGDMPELGAAARTRDFFFSRRTIRASGGADPRSGDARRCRAATASPHEIQVLSPMHRGELGAGNLNQLLQEALTTGARRRARRAQPARRRQGDAGAQRLRQGGVERRQRRHRTHRRRDETLLDPLRRSRDRLRLDELDTLALAYAATVHKSQGRVPGGRHPGPHAALRDAAAKPLYTAVTRGKRLVCWSARARRWLAVRNADVAARCSGWPPAAAGQRTLARTSRRRRCERRHRCCRRPRSSGCRRADAGEHGGKDVIRGSQVQRDPRRRERRGVV
jgi:exodeoxyribonuclease V alpha subunit